ARARLSEGRGRWFEPTRTCHNSTTHLAAERRPSMHHHHHSHVLQLDIQGTPQAWISLEHAALHVATGSVAWVDGHGLLATLRGGFNIPRGRQSTIDVHPIIALHGASKVNLFDVVPAFGKLKLFRRDRFTCAYCGQRFHERDLQCEHVVPQSRGGRWTWMNL